MNESPERRKKMKVCSYKWKRKKEGKKKEEKKKETKEERIGITEDWKGTKSSKESIKELVL